MDFNTVANDEVITRTIEALKKNGIDAMVVENGEAAKAKVLEMIPKGAEVMTMTSVTNDTIGLNKELNESGNYAAVRSKLYDEKIPAKEKRQLGAAPDYAVGSVHAITEDGQLVIASNTGSQLPAYLYGAEHVIWVAGANKIVPDLEAGRARVYEHVLPQESVRANKAYNITTGSFVSKLVVIAREVNPQRARMIIVKEQLGF